MANNINIYEDCTHCVEGIITDDEGNQIACTSCNGLGWIPLQKVDIRALNTRFDIIEAGLVKIWNKVKDL